MKFNFEPLINHIIDTQNTPLEQRDMIGSVVRYKELSPNWMSVIRELNLHRMEHKNASKFYFGVNNKQVVGFSTQEKGLYGYYTSTALLSSMFYKALSNNSKLDTSHIRASATEGLSELHPLVLVLEMLGKSNGVALVTNWVPYKDDPEKFFPTHNLLVK